MFWDQRDYCIDMLYNTCKLLKSGSYFIIVNILLFMAALRTFCFYRCSYYLSSFFFSPRLFSAVADWLSTILPHMMWS